MQTHDTQGQDHEPFQLADDGSGLAFFFRAQVLSEDQIEEMLDEDGCGLEDDEVRKRNFQELVDGERRDDSRKPPIEPHSQPAGVLRNKILRQQEKQQNVEQLIDEETREPEPDVGKLPVKPDPKPIDQKMAHEDDERKNNLEHRNFYQKRSKKSQKGINQAVKRHVLQAFLLLLRQTQGLKGIIPKNMRKQKYNEKPHDLLLFST